MRVPGDHEPGDRRYDHGDRHGDRGDPGGQGVGRQGRRGARKLAWDYTTSTLLSASIHPTSANGDSPKFAVASSPTYAAASTR
jgi:hypothetical protein